MGYMPAYIQQATDSVKKVVDVNSTVFMLNGHWADMCAEVETKDGHNFFWLFVPIFRVCYFSAICLF